MNKPYNFKPRAEWIFKPIICGVCETQFIPSSSRSKYCGPVCLKRNQEKRYEAWKQLPSSKKYWRDKRQEQYNLHERFKSNIISDE